MPYITCVVALASVDQFRVIVVGVEVAVGGDVMVSADAELAKNPTAVRAPRAAHRLIT